MLIHGKTLKDDIVLASCDEQYLYDHGPSFVNSASRFHNVHLNLVNPNTHAMDFANELNCTWSTSIGASNREYYSVSRFFAAKCIMESFPDLRIITLDIDCLVLKPLTFYDSMIGLYFRNPDDTNPANDWEREGMHVAAGIVHTSGDIGRQFLQEVWEIIESNNLRWFADQVALYRASQKFAVDKQYDKSYIDWEFKPNSHIWTAKGNRKADKTYLNMKGNFL